MSARSLLAAAMVFAAAPAAGGTEPQIGKPAPAFTAVDSNGQQVRLADFRGKVVVLEWTNHQCPYVRKHYGAGNMQKTQGVARERGVVWLSLISSAPGEQGHVAPAEANALVAARGAKPSHVLLDPQGEIGRAYGARVTPHMYIIDAEGVLLYAGAIDSIPSWRTDDIAKAKNYVIAALDEIGRGQKVTDSSTRAYGCLIHYKSS